VLRLYVVLTAHGHDQNHEKTTTAVLAKQRFRPVQRFQHYQQTVTKESMSNIRGLFDGKKDDDSDDDSKGNNNRFVGGITSHGGGR
jgi:hypothetical protein